VRALLFVLLLTACEDVTPSAPPPPPPARPGPRPSKADPPKPAELIETARKAVVEKRWAAAQTSLTMLEVLDTTDTYKEERLFLQVRTLMAITPNEVAEQKADEFHLAFPSSPLGPSVEAELQPMYALEPARAKARERKVKALIRRGLLLNGR